MKWGKFLKELSNLAFFWFFGIVYFLFFRIAFIAIFHKQLGASTTPQEFLKVLFTGFRFDCTVVGWFLLPPLLALFTLAYSGKFEIIKKTRLWAQFFFLFFSSFICLLTLNFYSEYNEQFNNFTFLALYDDQTAILNTIIDYYHPWLNLLAMVVIIAIGWLVFRFFEERTTLYRLLQKADTRKYRILLVTLSVFLFIGSLRGTLGIRTINRRWASVSKDIFLNKTVINPYRALKYAYRDFTLLGFGQTNPFGEEDLHALFQKKNVLEVLEKRAAGNRIEKPKQIFLVIMESYDSWPLMKEYAAFGLSESVHQIAQNGVHFTNFLPAYNATMYAYNTITTGIPYCGVQLNYMGGINKPYATSVFNQFKALGYTTNFFYGGFISWQRIGEFTSYQGCDHIYSGVDTEDESMGFWGVEDEKLFDLVLDKIDPNEYTFNVILTGSYHSPYEIDVAAKGFPYQSPDDFPEEVRKYYDKGMTLQEIGHLWYSDRSIGRFMERASKEYAEALYSFTGDHYGRRFLNHTPTLYEKSSVPFIVYNKNLPAERRDTPGDHSDIIPTLIELVAPEGFTYYSFGSSLFDENKRYGMGFEKAIDKEHLYYFPKNVTIEQFGLTDTPTEETFQYEEEYRRRLKLSWHYAMHGESLIQTEKIASTGK